MADNYVAIKIKASDTAKPDLTGLKADLERLGAMVETAQVDVDDREAGAKLLDLNAKLADLNRKVVNPRITAAGAARVEAQLAAIGLAFDKLGDKTARPKVELEGAAEATLELTALDLELDHVDGKLGRLGGMADRAGPGGLLGKILGSAQDLPVLGNLLGPAGLAIVPAVAALLPELAGLVSGFAAAGAGAGAFGLLAAPAVKSVETAYTNLSKAQAAFHAAQAKEGAAPSKANEAAVKAAADNLKVAQNAISKLPGSEKGAVTGLQHLFDAFHKISNAFKPTAFKVFNDLLNIANTLLPDVAPLATTFANALDGLLGKADKAGKSKGFKDWLKQFQGIEGPAITAIGNGIGNVATAFGKLLTVMSGKDVAHAINIAFGAAAGIINGVTWTVKLLMGTWDAVAVQFSLSGHMIASAFDTVRHKFASIGHDFAHTFDDIRHAAATWFHDLAHVFDEVRHTIATWVSNVATDGGKVITWFKNLPGKIINGLGDLASMLHKAGVKAIQGLMDGMGSMIGTLEAKVEGWGHDIANKLGSAFGIHFSEPSEATQMVKAGQRIPLGLAAGMLSGNAALGRAAAVVSASAYPHPGGGHGLAGAGSGKITLEVTGGGQSQVEQFLLLMMRNLVRVKGGGDVQKAFGRA